MKHSKLFSLVALAILLGGILLLCLSMLGDLLYSVKWETLGPLQRYGLLGGTCMAFIGYLLYQWCTGKLVLEALPHFLVLAFTFLVMTLGLLVLIEHVSLGHLKWRVHDRKNPYDRRTRTFS